MTAGVNGDFIGPEIERLAFIEARDGKEGATDFAQRTLKVYEHCLSLSRSALDAAGQRDRPAHHATLQQYRPAFLGSCAVFRRYLRGESLRKDGR